MTLFNGLLFLLILTLLVDLAMILRVRRDLKHWGIDQTNPDRAVFVLGRYSGLLTWIRNLRSNNRAAKPASQAGFSLLPTINSPEQPLVLGKVWWEFTLIFLVVFLFCSAFLDLGASTRLPGNESELFQTYDWVLVNSLQKYGQFPLWNPYVYTGIPFVADPMSHVYNPVVTLPVLLFGVRVGFKLAIFFSFLLAAFGMWRLGWVLGIASPARIYMALMYTFAGQPIARFFQGEYLFVLAFAWLPWIFASLFRLVQTGRRRYIAEAALFMALFYFCGNAYYQLYMLILAGIFTLLMVLRFNWPAVQPHRLIWLDLSLLKTLFLVAVLTLGIISIHLLPLVELWPRLTKDTKVEGSHSLSQIFLDYTSKDTHRPDAFLEYPASEEFYAYIGLTPFLALLFLPFAWKKHPKKVFAFFFLMIGFVLVWIRQEAMPWYDLFVDTRLLVQFRILLRVLIFGNLGLIILAGISLDRLWELLKSLRASLQPENQTHLTWNRTVGYWLSLCGLVALGFFMAAGVADLYTTHRPYVRTQEIYEPAYTVAGWLRQYDPSTYYVRHQTNNSWYEPIVSSELRYIDMWFPYLDIRLPPPYEERRYVQAQPNYLIQPSSQPDTSFPAMRLVATIDGYNIFHLDESLPFAFLVSKAVLAQDSGGEWLKANEVTALDAFVSGPGKIEVIVNGDFSGEPSFTDNILVILVSQYPGWQIRVDGKIQPLSHVAGYLAVQVVPGIHRYEFSYQPVWFYVGLFISLLTLATTLYLLVSDFSLDCTRLRQRWHNLMEGMHRLRNLPGHWLDEPERMAEAVVRQGVIHPEQPLDYPDETRLSLAMVKAVDSISPLQQATRRWLWASARLGKVLAASIVLEKWLFGAAILVYLATRLVGLLDYPIYFFTDEAVQTLLASDLVRDGFASPEGELLPTYFRNVDHYNLSTSVYLQVIPYLLFGKSAYITRLASVLMTLLAALSVGLILRDGFKVPYWWSATLILSITPAWFLHSRTAFEVVLMVSFYAAAIYYYLLYRYRSPRALYPSLILFALAFYSYSPGQVVVVVTAAGLFLSDLPYHWRQRLVGLRGIGLLALLILPYMRFRLSHPTAFEEHLITLNSYWIQSIPLQEKLSNYFKEYLLGLNPMYWFFPNQRDLARHVMGQYGNLLRATLPFVGIGILICLKEIRSSAHRLLLIALLAAPTGAAMAQIAVTRALVMVIPASLLAGVGLIAVMRWLEKRAIPSNWLALGVFFVLSLMNLWMLRDALVNGPTWSRDYGLMGMQYGARQIYAEAQDYARQHPGSTVLVSPVWANGPDILARFFLSPGAPISLESINAYMFYYRPISPQAVFVMTPEEYQAVLTSEKFSDIQVDRIVPYPDGQPGFYFIRLQYVENIEDILASERIERRKLQVQDLAFEGQVIHVRHSLLDSGKISEIFDSSRHSLARTMEANPFILELTFPQPRNISGLSLVIGDTEIQLRVLLYTPDAPEPVRFDFIIDASPQNPQGSVDFGQEYLVSVLYLEIKDMRQGEPGHVHLWELIFQ